MTHQLYTSGGEDPRTARARALHDCASEILAHCENNDIRAIQEVARQMRTASEVFLQKREEEG